MEGPIISESSPATTTNPLSRSKPSPTALLIQAHFSQSKSTLPRLPPPPPPQTQPWTPTPCFFYGTLTDPELLQTLLSLPDPSLLRPGTISGFEIKMWGMYPALVVSATTAAIKEGEEGDEKEIGKYDERPQVPRMIYEVQTEAQFQKLQRYETAAYTWCTCDVVLNGGERVEGVRTFRWAGDPKSGQLKEGAFDRGRWQVYFKKSVLGKADAG